MKLFLFKGQKILTCVLPEKPQGQYWIMHTEEESAQGKLLGIEGIQDQWMLKSNKRVHLLNEKNEVVPELALKAMEVYRVLLTETNETALLYSEVITDDRKVFEKVALPVDGSILIGRSEQCDIRYQNKYVSGTHTKITIKQGIMTIESLSQSNGTYVNGIRVTNKVLQPGDIVYIIGFQLIIGQGFIAMNNPDNQVTYNRLILRSYEKQQNILKEDELEDLSEEEINTYKIFYKPPRIQEKIEPLELQIDEPPAPEKNEQLPLLLVLGPSLTMGVASLITGIYTFQYALTNNGNLRFAIPTLIMSICMLIGTITFPILNRKHRAKKLAQKEQLRKSKYMQYLTEIDEEIEAARNKQRTLLYANHLSVDTWIEKIQKMQPSLWERTYDHADFLEVRVGIGDVDFQANIKSTQKRFRLEDDDLQEAMLSIANRPKLVENVPVTLNFKKDYITGVVGQRPFINKFAKNILFQMAAMHSYDELKFVFLYNQKDEATWDFVKWFPHVWNNDEDFRFIATNKQELKELSSNLNKEIVKRQELEERELEQVLPHYVVFVLDNELSLKAQFVDNIFTAKKALGFSVIQLDEEYVNLAKECSAVIYNKGNVADIIRKEDASKTQRIIADVYEGNQELAILKDLANIRLLSSDTAFALPERLTFLEMFGVGKIEHLNPLTRWRVNDPTVSLEARLGIDGDGEWINLDLHEKFHGPHGLIAGMTGSGKSEFIMTYILSLAINYHPHEVAFILIDYKGGGMANTFTNLPHVAGTITNLDGASVNRSLVSIQSELRRRQAIFNEVGRALEISNIDIYKYQKLYREGKVQEPLQHLFIISDEFAELKSQQPDFMQQLISAARIGRSLGIHLILATQKPSGVVDDQIWSNSKFRISLKVQERADSMDVIKRPDAAELSVTGRFYLQVGYNELFELGQSAWAGAPYYPSEKMESTKEESVAILNKLGQVIAQVREESNRQFSPDAPKQIDEITKYLATIAKEEQIQVRSIWLEPIPAMIYVDELLVEYGEQAKVGQLNPVIGKYDDPENQQQLPLFFPLSEEGNAIIYGTTGSGKTTFLTSVIVALSKQYTPEEVNFYVLDYASETLKPFAQLPHVGDVLTSEDVEKTQKLFLMLMEMMRERKKLVANYGGDFRNYVEHSGQSMPSIVVMIHNFTAFYEFNAQHEDAFVNLIREGAKYGIHVILTSLTPDGVRTKYAQNFKQQFVLQLNDKSAYAGVLGSVGGVYPSKYKGRGIFKDDKTYEFQVAHALEDVSFETIRAYCKTMTERYPTMKAKRVPILPEVIDLTYLEEQGADFQQHLVPIGVDKQTLKIEYYNLQQLSIHSVFHKYEGNNGFLEYLATAIARNKNRKVIVIDAQQSFAAQSDAHYDYHKDQFDAVIVAMFNTLVQRNNRYKDAINAGQDVPVFENVTYIIQSLSKLTTLLTDDSNEKFNLLIERAEKEYNVTFILFENVDDASKYINRPWYKKHGSDNTGLWLGNGISTQFTMKAKNANRLNEEIGSDFGYSILKSEPVLVKYATAQAANEEV